MRRLGQLLRELSLLEVYRGHSLQELLVVVWFGLLGELKMSLILRLNVSKPRSCRGSLDRYIAEELGFHPARRHFEGGGWWAWRRAKQKFELRR